MIYTDMTKKALVICFNAHKDQVDKSGMPYVFHPFHLAEQMKDEDTTIVALLHDVVEDTEYDIAHLRKIGFSESILEAISVLTHDGSTPYMDYISKIKTNPIARTVKLADLCHNSDITRLNNVQEKDLRRIRKYRVAQAMLEPDYSWQIIDEDRNFINCYRKSIPLEETRLYFLTIFYNDSGILNYSFDVEAASDSHYEFDEAAGETIRKALDPSVSLPEALMEFMSCRNDWDFIELLGSLGLSYQSFHY